jgi:hypothetical protein
MAGRALATFKDRKSDVWRLVMVQRGIKHTLLAGVIGVSLIGLAGCSDGEVDTTTRDDSGEITEAGDLGVFALNTGDCVNDPDLLSGAAEADPAEADEVTQFDAVPCSEPHTAEVVLVDDDFFAGMTEFPGADEVWSQSSEACAVAVEDYTGEPFLSSPYDVVALYPTEQSWDAVDDRGIACLALVLSEQTGEPIESAGSVKAPA